MALMEGTRELKVFTFSYDFAVDGGAVSTITLRSNDGPIPTGSYIMGGVLDVATALTSGGSATAALQIEAANDTVNAAAFSGTPWSAIALKSLIEAFTGATVVKTTASRNPKLVIGTAALTAGKFTLTVFFK
jgi:hypothetical protein